MYGIFTYIYHKHDPHVGIYTSPMDPMGFWEQAPKNNASDLENPKSSI